MEPIKGYEIQGFKLTNYYKVSDLIYYDGPILSHYINDNGDNYLLCWCDSDVAVNRWMLSKVSLINLHEYLEGKDSLLNLFEKNTDDVIRMLDVDDGINIISSYITDFASLSESYKPKNDSYYKFKPKFSEQADEYYLNIGESGVLQAIFKNNRRIGYGTIPMDFFSPTLHHLNEINNGLGNAYYKGKNKNRPVINGNRKVPKFNKEDILPQTQFEIAGSGPGSFKLYLRPLVSQKSIGEEPTETDNYFTYFTNFISSTFQYEKLLQIVKEVPIEVINHYEKLLKNIETHRFDFLLKWENPSSHKKIEVLIEKTKVATALENISKLEYQNTEEIKLVGKFMELNLLTKHYTFIQDNGEEKIESRGHFDELIRDGIVMLQFNKVYEVTIARKESKETGQKRPTVKDILRAFYIAE